MIESIVSSAGSVIVGLIAFAGVVITSRKSQREVQFKIETAQAVTDSKIEELTREVREHNGFARRMPVVEEQIKSIDCRLIGLEKK